MNTSKTTRKPTPAGALLLKWIGDNKLTNFQFCAQSDIEPGLLYRWIYGRSVPSVNYAALIERLTGIPAGRWANPGFRSSQRGR
jgi:hypothetical protein